MSWACPICPTAFPSTRNRRSSTSGSSRPARPWPLRPYFQEGFLVGTTDLTDNYDDKNELDFNRRLIAKFVIPNDDSFWNGNLHKIPKELLFLDEKNDAMHRICSSIRGAVQKTEEMLFESGENSAEVDELTAVLRRRLRKK